MAHYGPFAGLFVKHTKTGASPCLPEHQTSDGIVIGCLERQPAGRLCCRAPARKPEDLRHSANFKANFGGSRRPQREAKSPVGVHSQASHLGLPLNYVLFGGLVSAFNRNNGQKLRGLSNPCRQACVYSEMRLEMVGTSPQASTSFASTASSCLPWPFDSPWAMKSRGGILPHFAILCLGARGEMVGQPWDTLWYVPKRAREGSWMR